MKKVLVMEDEAAIREFLVINLQRAGYETVAAADGEEAIRLFDEANGTVDIVLLDVMVPKIDGMEVCKRIRQKSNIVGIMMLTAKSQEHDKINGLVLGADDYITKPFSPSEVIVRVDALYRRISIVKESRQTVSNEIRSGRFVLNLHRRELSSGDNVFDLTQLEFQIMEHFFKNEGKLISRVELLETVWGNDFKGEDKIVDVNIRRLRIKIEEDPSDPRHILTIWGQGYKWQG